MPDIKEKIIKLLSLADSPNEHEAKAALLKARKLMAEHNLTMGDVGKQTAEIVSDDIGVTCTSMTNPWVISLSTVIAKQYRCRSFARRAKGAKVYRIFLVGTSDDFEVCKTIYMYAYDYIISRCKELSETARSEGYSAKEIRLICNAYGNGFVSGLKQAYKEQEDAHQEWGLVMQAPQPVLDVISKMKNQRIGRPTPDWTSHFHSTGFKEGKKFDPSTKLE